MIGHRMESIAILLFFIVNFSVRSATSVGGPVAKQAGTLLAPAFYSKPTNCECGRINRKIDDERFGKVRVSGGRIPWLAELITKNDFDGEEYRLCFGTLISLRMVLFPASCINKWSRTMPQVKLWGIENPKESIKKVASFQLHPGYRGKFDNDIALVKLASVIASNNTEVVPICLHQVPRNFAHPPHLLQQSLNNGTDNGTNLEISLDINNSSSVRIPCKNPNPKKCPKPVETYKQKTSLEFMVTRTWFFRKAPGYDDIQKFGRFYVLKADDNQCRNLYPEMLQSKLACVKPKIVKEVQKYHERFFHRLELGMGMMTVNTTIVGKGKKDVRYYLDSMRAPGHGGIPMLTSRENLIPLLKIHDYIPWIRANSYEGHFCKS